MSVRNKRLACKGRPSLYTPTQDAFIRMHYPTHKDRRWIANQIGVRVSQLECRAARLGVTRPKKVGAKDVTGEKLEKFKAAFLGGATSGELAAWLGCSKDTVCKIARRHGLKRDTEYFRKAAKAAAERRAQEGDTPRCDDREISRMYAGQRYEDMRLRS